MDTYLFHQEWESWYNIIWSLITFLLDQNYGATLLKIQQNVKMQKNDENSSTSWQIHHYNKRFQESLKITVRLSKQKLQGCGRFEKHNS